jgi:hypothetical protein
VKTCICGEPLVEVTWSGDRAIINLQTQVTIAPVTMVCIQGHRTEFWLTKDDAMPYFEDAIMVAR